MVGWVNTDFGERKVLNDQQPEKKIQITINKRCLFPN
jgi:hypothetical protein